MLLGGALILLVSVLYSSVSGDTAPAARESDYDIYSRGFRVGELKTICEVLSCNEKRVLKFASSTRVKINLLLYSFTLDNREEALISDEGTISYRRTTREKDSVCDVEGRMAHGRFLLDISENGIKHSMAVDREKYDYTSMECPETAMKHEGDEMTLRLLDLDTLMLVNRRYRWIKNEEVTIDGRKINCRVIDFSDVNKQCRRWIRPDAAGAIIVRQEGTGKNGRYSLRMAHLRDS
ncbi:MAG TPA: hypothetical protein VMJ66_17575 [Geobacteraceae bacterium]|nr:hypothetical protein [Geobacteraceae bacterium]